MLPVEGLVFDGAEKTGAVIMTIDQKNYSPYRMLVNFVMAEGCASFIPGYVEKAVLEQWFADNAGHTMEEFILANQAYQEQFGDIPGEFSVEPETEYVVYAQPYDADHRPLEPVTETYRTKALVRSGERMTGSYAWLAADRLELRFEFSSEAVERYWLVVYTEAGYENSFKKQYADELRGLLSEGSVYPADEAVRTLSVSSGQADRYVVLAVPESADGIGELCTFTVEAQRSAAALSSLDVDASDRSFVVRFVNDGSAYVRFGAFQGGVSDEDLKATLAGGGNLLEFESESASVEREFVNFKPLTDYTVAALAFDADGVAGGFYRADFTTLDLIPGEDSEAPEIHRYLGPDVLYRCGEGERPLLATRYGARGSGRQVLSGFRPDEQYVRYRGDRRCRPGLLYGRPHRIRRRHSGSGCRSERYLRAFYFGNVHRKWLQSVRYLECGWGFLR